MIRIYTDGAWRRKEKAAGAAAIFVSESGEISVYHISLGDETNNRAELQAIKLALTKAHSLLNKSSPITLYSDSTYAIGILTQNWKARANQQLIEEITQYINQFDNLTFKWVKAHSKNKYNRLADLIANIAIDQYFGRDTEDWKNPLEGVTEVIIEQDNP